MNNMLLTCCAFLVLKKAFDVIDHSRLNKLEYSVFETMSSNGLKITFLIESNTCKLMVLPQTKGLSVMEYQKKKKSY